MTVKELRDILNSMPPNADNVLLVTQEHDGYRNIHFDITPTGYDTFSVYPNVQKTNPQYCISPYDGNWLKFQQGVANGNYDYTECTLALEL